MKVTFDVNLKEKDVFDFNIYQAYRGMQGILSIVLPILIIAVAIHNYGQVKMSSTIIYIGIAIFLLAYVPVSLWFRSKKAFVTNEALAKTLHYEFSEDTICVTQEDQKAEFKWENVYKMVATKKMVLVYTNRMNAYIIPREQIQDAYPDLAALAKSQLDKFRVSMK